MKGKQGGEMKEVQKNLCALIGKIIKQRKYILKLYVYVVLFLLLNAKVYYTW